MPNYRVGDQIDVRMTVISVEAPCVHARTPSSTTTWVANGDIINHIPAPRSIKVGDTVTWGNTVMNCRLLWISDTQMLIVKYGEAVLMARPGDLEVVD